MVVRIRNHLGAVHSVPDDHYAVQMARQKKVEDRNGYELVDDESLDAEEVPAKKGKK